MTNATRDASIIVPHKLINTAIPILFDFVFIIKTGCFFDFLICAVWGTIAVRQGERVTLEMGMSLITFFRLYNAELAIIFAQNKT